jgi:hypothetical protein
VREPSFRQESPRLVRVVTVVPGTGHELIDARRPLGYPAREGGGRLPLDEDGVEDRLPIDPMGDRAARAHVVEGRLVRSHVDPVSDVGEEILVDEVRPPFFEPGEILLAHDPFCAVL